ncbi:MAG: TRAP transporter substrate-binding protein DctP [Chloroflexi bacterium]|nr:TRAP transporter substrate-binding protein DctP [Chloroflexota bacterium]
MAKSKVFLLVNICLVLVLALSLSLACKAPATTAPAPTVTVTAKPAPAPTVTVTPATAPTVTVAPAPAPTVTVAPAPAPTVTVTAPAPSPTPSPAPSPTPTATAAPITWKVLRPWPLESNDVIGYREFLKRVNERSGGRLVLKDIGGSEVYPTNQQFEPLQLGTVDLLFTSSGYIADKLPELVALMYQFGASLSEIRSAALVSKLDEYSRAVGVTLLGVPIYYTAHVYTTRPITKLADLKTFKLRSHPSYDPLVKALGIPVAQIGFADIFTALDRRTIDGVVYVPWDIITYGWEKAIKYRVDPPFWRAGWGPFLANLKSWNALGPALQKLMTDTMLGLENDLPQIEAQPMLDEWAKLKALGVQRIVLSDEEWFQTQTAGWQGLQDQMTKLTPTRAQEIIRLLSQFYPPKAPYKTLVPLD